MDSKIDIHSHSIVTVLRPDGEVECVRRTEKFNPALFARIKAATKAAGRGECLSYVNHSKMVDVPAEYLALDASEKAYDAQTAAIYRAMDAAREQEPIDSTPAHASDM